MGKIGNKNLNSLCGFNENIVMVNIHEINGNNFENMVKLLFLYPLFIDHLVLRSPRLA